MQQGTGDVEPPVKDDELGLGLLHALAHTRLSLLVSCQPLLQNLRKSLVHPTLSIISVCVYFLKVFSYITHALYLMDGNSPSVAHSVASCSAIFSSTPVLQTAQYDLCYILMKTDLSSEYVTADPDSMSIVNTCKNVFMPNIPCFTCSSLYLAFIRCE